MITIIHVSDLHLESEKPSQEKLDIISAFVYDLQKQCDENTLLFFTGDLIDKGAKNFKEKEKSFYFFECLFIDKILEACPFLRGKIFIVPGNHDVYRDKIDQYSESGLKSSLDNVKKLDEFIQSNRVESTHLGRLQDYKKWETKFYEKYNNKPSNNFEFTYNLQLNKYKVGITCLNSSWLCKDDTDKENILLGKNQIDNSISNIQDCHVKLALSHHPLEFFKEFDREALKISIYKNYDILFTGHVHELASSYTQDLLGNIFISIANSTIGDFPSERKYVNGYSIIKLYPNEKIVACYRKYIETNNTFVPNTDIGTEDGTKTFNILKDNTLKLFESNQRIVEGIESRFFDKLNDHIITSSNYTGVSCTIDGLFVEPTILNNPQGNYNVEDTIKYTISSIINSANNFIIYGMKESGKTILLDKMFIEATRKFNQLNKIPILLNFNDFKDKDIVRVIREFISVSSSEIQDFLKSNSIIIFIDDIYFNEKSLSQIDKLKRLIIDYPNVQFIATANLSTETIMPIDYLGHNDIFKANIIFIQNFGSKEIKQLIQKWYAGKEVDLQENMEKLIRSFADFGLPKNPLSVTLFLWIFEKQEKRPINNSVLVELFIENILEKTNIENIYSEIFDFTNKKRLLSFIARRMNDIGDSDYNYAVDYVDLLDFIKNYLLSRFTGQPQKVLDDFIKRGILTCEGDNLVRFKSAFIFHYFLALHFDYDPSFKEYVFTDDNYLNYIEEITYYTGLKRDDIHVLKYTQEKLIYAFGEFNQDIKLNYKKVDKVLESKKEGTITFQIDEKKAASKLTEQQMDEMYDDSLTIIPVSKVIEKKEKSNQDTKKQIDKVLKLACNVLKNSEDVDDFEYKKLAYQNVITSSISLLIQFRDSLILHFLKYKKQPDHFPKNIDFHLFIRLFPLVHQVVLFNWVGSQKLKPVILDKIKKDEKALDISELERFLSVFIYSDIKGSDYPDYVKKFVKISNKNYIMDLSFLKILSYYNLRKNSPQLDSTYLRLMADIKQSLGHLHKNKKSQFMRQLKDKKKGSI